MSMCICGQCGDLIDSDFDPDCFLEGERGGAAIICQSCRDNADRLETEDSINSQMRNEFEQANGRFLK